MSIIVNAATGELIGTFSDSYRQGHADYPHTPGTLYDCYACESECFCADVNAGQVDVGNPLVCVHCAITAGECLT